MSIASKIKKEKFLTFIIQTVVPFIIPFIFEIPDKIIVFGAKFAIVVILSIIDLILIFAIDKEEKNQNQVLFKNFAARCAYSHIYELNESRRDYYIENVEKTVDIIPYNPRSYINQISWSFSDVIGEITHIEKEYMSVAFIYKIEGDNEWRWATRRESTFTISLGEFVKKEDTMFHTLINGSNEGSSVSFLFYNDKAEMVKQKKYRFGSRDRMHNNIGSIIGFRVGFVTDEGTLVSGILSISTYGRRLVEDNDVEKVANLQRLISDDLFPCYQRIFETELGVLYYQESNKRKGDEAKHDNKTQ